MVVSVWLFIVLFHNDSADKNVNGVQIENRKVTS